MPRKEKFITIQDRDQELTFKIREMPALRLESWMSRASALLIGTGAAGPLLSDVDDAGGALAESSLAALGNIDFDKAQPLLDELLACCSRVIEGIEERCTPQTVDNYILDVSTLLRLRMEAAALNLGFLGLVLEKLPDFLGSEHFATQQQ